MKYHEATEVPPLKRFIPACIAILFTMTVLLSMPCRGQTDRFFLKAAGGYSHAFLPNLSNELELQGREAMKGGYCGSISLGRTIWEKRWAVEFYFAVAFHPEFKYENEFDSFEENVSHYDYAVIFKRCLLPGGERIVPYIGIGAGYGVTNLISGGGKMQTVHGLALLQIEAPLGGNASLLIETAYGAGFTKERFEKPFLESVPGDAVLDSNGLPLEDRYSSFNVRIGFIAWLRPPKEGS